MSISAGFLLNIRALIERLAPAQPCLLCGTMSRDGLCCAECRAELPRLDHDICPQCARPTPGGDVCGECLRHAPAFDRTIAVFAYHFPVDHLIKALKFHENLIVANFLADALAERIEQAVEKRREDGRMQAARSVATETYQVDRRGSEHRAMQQTAHRSSFSPVCEVFPELIVAMPLHPNRLRNRGFNQSQLLAARLAQRLQLSLLTGCVRRVRDTPPQSSLPWQARNRNMRSAFALACGADVLGKHIAIVDDVMTSGASMNALAAALKQAGAREVSAWVVARTLPHR